MYQNDAIGQNILHMNDILVRMFKIILAAIAAIIILKTSGIIVLPWLSLITAAGVGASACLLPIGCRHMRMESGMLKYVNIFCAAVLCVLGYCYLNMGIIILLAVPIGLACMYFDAKLIRHAAAISSFGLVLGEAISGGANWRLATGMQGSFIRITLYILQFGIAAALLTAISKRAQKMFSQTYSFYENINEIFSNTQAASKGLYIAEDILLRGAGSLNGNNEKNEETAVESGEDDSPSNAKVKAILSNINKSMENAREIMRYTQTMFKGKGKELKAGDEVIMLEEYTRNSRELISKLAMIPTR